MHAEIIFSVLLFNGNRVVDVACVFAVYGDDKMVAQIDAPFARKLFLCGFIGVFQNLFGKFLAQIVRADERKLFGKEIAARSERFHDFGKLILLVIRNHFYDDFVAVLAGKVFAEGNEGQ